MAGSVHYQKVALQLDAENKKLKAKLAESKKHMDDFKKSGDALGGAMAKFGGIVAAAFTTEKIIAFGKEASKLAAEFEGVSSAFKRIGGDAHMDELKRATKGTVSELELMKRTVMASNFGIPIENLASLFEFATKRAQDTGQSVDYLVESIVLGIGRKSPLILDNLGISAVKLREELKGVGVESANVADIASIIGKIAQEEMAKAGGIIETTAVKTQQWGASWDNVKVSVGTLINDYLADIAPYLTGILALMDKMKMTSTTGATRAIVDNLTEGFDKMDQFDQEARKSYLEKSILEAETATFKLKLGIAKINNVPFIKQGVLGWLADDAKQTQLEDQLTNTTLRLNAYKIALQQISQVSTEPKVKKIIPDGDPTDTPAKIVTPEMTAEAVALQKINDDAEKLDQTYYELTNTTSGFTSAINALADSFVPLTYEMDLAIENQRALFEEFEEQKEAQLEGWMSIANAAGSMANGIANAKKNWAALVAVTASGIAQIIPAIKQVIEATKKLTAIKQSEAFVSAIAEGAKVTWPANIAAIASGVAAVTAAIAPFVGSFAKGTDFVPQTGMALVHKGEAIIPARQNKQQTLTAVVRGQDLHFIMNEYDRRRENTF